MLLCLWQGAAGASPPDARPPAAMAGPATPVDAPPFGASPLRSRSAPTGWRDGDRPLGTRLAEPDHWPHPTRPALAIRSTVDAEFRFRGSQASHINKLQADQEDLVRGVYQRIRLGARFSTSDLDAYLQLQSASVLGEAGPIQFRPPGSTASSPGDIPIPVGLQQGRLRWRAPWLEGLEVEIGRMALSYGHGRQIGRYDFHETGNAFDGLRLGYRMRDYLDVDAVLVKLRRNTAHPERERNLLGAYIAGRPVEHIESDLYFLWVTDGAEDLKSNLQTLGLRVQWRPWTWARLEAEGALQVGTQQPQGSAQEMDHFATMAVANLRLSYDVGLPLRLQFELQQYSGNDADSEDQVRAWRPLYPDLDVHLGLLQLFNQTNLRQIGAELQAGDDKGLRLRLALRINGSLANSSVPAFLSPTLSGEPGAWLHVGNEFDAVLCWPLFGNSDLVLASGIFMPSSALATKVGRAWARQVLVQWNSTF